MPGPTTATAEQPHEQADQLKPTRATVAISHTNEKHRSYETIYELAKTAIDELGGMRRFIRPGQSVLVKANVTVFYTAEEGCTTDPYLVAALAAVAGVAVLLAKGAKALYKFLR
jgi:uncharacterized protein (DUF362 family)